MSLGLYQACFMMILMFGKLAAGQVLVAGTFPVGALRPPLPIA